jgi:inner membrane protease ATP23
MACRSEDHRDINVCAAPMVHFMLRAMDERGCKLPATFVACVPEPAVPILGAYAPDDGRVYLNSVHVKDQKTVTRTLLHELVHAFDQCRTYFDPNNCRHVACTEVRAANLSDDCAFSAEMGRGHLDFRAGHKVRHVRQGRSAIVLRRDRGG